MKTKNSLYFFVSLILTLFGIFPRIISLLDDVIDAPNGEEVLVFYPLTVIGLLLGPVLCIVFLRLWIKESQAQKLSAPLSALPSDAPITGYSSSVPPSSIPRSTPTSETPVPAPTFDPAHLPLSASVEHTTSTPVSVSAPSDSEKSPQLFKKFVRYIASIWLILIVLDFFETMNKKGGNLSDIWMNFVLALPVVIILIIVIAGMMSAGRAIKHVVSKK